LLLGAFCRRGVDGGSERPRDGLHDERAHVLHAERLRQLVEAILDEFRVELARREEELAEAAARFDPAQIVRDAQDEIARRESGHAASESAAERLVAAL